MAGEYTHGSRTGAQASEARVRPYSAAEAEALGRDAGTLESCDQLGLGIIRVDGDAPALSRTAERWLGAELRHLVASPLWREACATTASNARWDYCCRSGRVLRIRRHAYRSKVWLVLQDMTLEHDHTHVMKGCSHMGMGFIQHVVKTRTSRIYGTFLDDMLSHTEQLELRRSNFVSIIHPRERVRYLDAVTHLVTDGGTLSDVFECTCRKRPSFHLQVRLDAVRTYDDKTAKLLGSFRDVSAEREARAELDRVRAESAARHKAQTAHIRQHLDGVRTPLVGLQSLVEQLQARPELATPERLALVAQGLRHASDGVRELDTRTDPAMRLDTPAADDAQTGHPGDGSHRGAGTAAQGLAALLQAAKAKWEPRVRARGAGMETHTDPALARDGLAGRILRAADSRERVAECVDLLLSFAAGHTAEGTVRLAALDTEAGPAIVVQYRSDGSEAATERGQPTWHPTWDVRVHARSLATRIGAELRNIESGDVRTLWLAFKPLPAGEVATQHTAAPSQAAQPAVAARPAGVAKPEGAPPPRPAEVAQDRATQGPAAHGPLGKLLILAVDDNEANRMVAKHLLEDVVAGVDVATDGMDALERLKTRRYDAVLMDIHMPRMDGVEATLAIRQSSEGFQDVPIIALTADARYQQKRMAVNIGMDDALAKPITQTKLLEAFERLNLGRAGEAEPRSAVA